MPVLYDNTLMTPAPLAGIVQNTILAGDGTKLGYTYSITLHGWLLAVPPGSGLVTEARLGSLLTQQNNLSNLFSHSGRLLEIYSPDGSAVTQCNPRVHSINFPEGNWVDTINYTVELEADTIYPSDTAPENIDSPYFVSNSGESWQIEEAGMSMPSGVNSFGLASPQPTWRLTHTVSAVGKTHYDVNGNLLPPWEQARDWVFAHLATDTFGGKPFNTLGELNISASQPYNYSRVENIDTKGGSFSMTETWLMAFGSPAVEEYTINVKRSSADQTVTTVTINGVVTGLSQGLNDPSAKISNALNYFNSSVLPNLSIRASGVVPETQLNTLGTNGTLDYNYKDGTISYAYEYNDMPTNGNNTVYDTFTVTKKTDISAYETTVTVAGVVQGLLQVGESPNAYLLKFQRAQAYWNTIVNGLLGRAQTTGVSDLKPASTQGSVDYDFFSGKITYSYEFTNRPFNTVKNDYTLSLKFNRNDGMGSASINGTVQGLLNSSTDFYTVKYANALNFWTAYEPTIFGVVDNFASSLSLNSNAVSKSRGDNPLNGSITYDYEYDTTAQPVIPGAIYQNLTLVDGGGNPIMAVINIPGKANGPVIQDLGTVNVKEREVSLDVTMVAGSSEPNTDDYINEFQPNGSSIYVVSDSKNWNPVTCRYTRQIRWNYE